MHIGREGAKAYHENNPDYELDVARGRLVRPVVAGGEPPEALEDFQPLLDYVVVRKDKGDEKSKGGIILTNPADPVEGRVVFAGPGNHQHGVFIKNRIEPGMWVRFGQWANNSVKIGDEVFLIMREEDIIGHRPARRVTAEEARAGK